MQVVKSSGFGATRAWGAKDLTVIDGASVRLHWTDAPYHWHRNDGTGVFAVLDGVVLMHLRDGRGTESVVRLESGDLVVANEGDEHCAEPIGEARILVIEREGSE